MNTIRLSAIWETPRQAHEALAMALSFPEYYGHNLDALYDCLTDLPDTLLILENCGLAAQNMPEKWPRFLRVMEDAACENRHLKIRLFEYQAP